MGVDQPECGAGRSSPAKWSNTNTGEKNSEHPNVARQFKPFGSANSCPQSIHSKAWYHRARSKKFTTVSTRPAKEAIGLTEALPPRKDGGLLKPLCALLWMR